MERDSSRDPGSSGPGSGEGDAFLPAGFVYVDEVVKGVVIDQKYATADNFTEAPVPGYAGNRPILTRAAADRLADAQSEALDAGWSFLVWDAYRPETAVAAFFEWKDRPATVSFQRAFCPRLDKKILFEEGYIAAQSSHSRGSTVDLTLCRPAAGQTQALTLLDTGGTFDLFDPLSHTESPEITPVHLANRRFLRSLMARHGFENFPKEWWHYTLVSEPFPGRSFSFPVHPHYRTRPRSAPR